MQNEWVLAVHAGHNASAALMRDGVILVAAVEERFTRTKNYVGYPYHSIEYCMKSAGISGADIYRVGYTTVNIGSSVFIKARTSTAFSLKDYREYYGDKYYRRRLEGESVLGYLQWLDTDKKFNVGKQHYDFSYLNDDVFTNTEKDRELFANEQRRMLSSQLGISSDRIEFIDHHTCHAHYAYFSSPYRGGDCIAVTLDGEGDGRNQTVWKVHDDTFALLADSFENDIGHIYKMATLILAMRPDEHEFKVMGLAPYAKRSHVLRAMEPLRDLCAVDGMRIVSKNRPADLYGYLEDAWKDHRFDNIAGAVQTYTEEMACELIRNIARETGIGRFVLGGGIAMNIKMNKAISELEEVDALFVGGSSGDESLSIGGCYAMSSDVRRNRPLSNMYLGFDIADEIDDLDPASYEDRFVVQVGATHDQVAQILARGDIVAVARGESGVWRSRIGQQKHPCKPQPPFDNSKDK